MNSYELLLTYSLNKQSWFFFTLRNYIWNRLGSKMGSAWVHTSPRCCVTVWIRPVSCQPGGLECVSFLPQPSWPFHLVHSDAAGPAYPTDATAPIKWYPENVEMLLKVCVEIFCLWCYHFYQEDSLNQRFLVDIFVIKRKGSGPKVMVFRIEI